MRAAPAACAAWVAAARVAPLVRTSSTNKTSRPANRSSRFGLARIASVRMSCRSCAVLPSRLGVRRTRWNRSGQWASPRVSGDHIRQQGGLVIPTLQQPRPMQRDRRHQHVPRDYRPRRLRHPDPRGTRHIRAVTMFQRHNQLARAILIHQRRAPGIPGLGVAHAIIAFNTLAIALTW